MSRGLILRLWASGILLLMAFLGLFDFSRRPEKQLAMVAACYFGVFEVLLYGEPGLDRVDSVLDRFVTDVDSVNSGPNRSLKEFEGGERP